MHPSFRMFSKSRLTSKSRPQVFLLEKVYIIRLYLTYTLPACLSSFWFFPTLTPKRLFTRMCPVPGCSLLVVLSCFCDITEETTNMLTHYDIDQPKRKRNAHQQQLTSVNRQKEGGGGINRFTASQHRESPSPPRLPRDPPA